MVVVGTSEPKNDGEKKGGKKKIKIHKSIFWMKAACSWNISYKYIFFCVFTVNQKRSGFYKYKIKSETAQHTYPSTTLFRWKEGGWVKGIWEITHVEFFAICVSLALVYLGIYVISWNIHLVAKHKSHLEFGAVIKSMLWTDSRTIDDRE